MKSLSFLEHCFFKAVSKGFPSALFACCLNSFLADSHCILVYFWGLCVFYLFYLFIGSFDVSSIMVVKISFVLSIRSIDFVNGAHKRFFTFSSVSVLLSAAP